MFGYRRQRNGDAIRRVLRYRVPMAHARTTIDLAPPLDESSFRKLLYGMRSVGLKVLKNKLSEYVRLAAGGETVLVTDRDRVVAELVPPRQQRHEWLDNPRLAVGVREGWVTPATAPPGTIVGLKPKPVPGMTLERLLTDLEHDRADR